MFSILRVKKMLRIAIVSDTYFFLAKSFYEMEIKNISFSPPYWRLKIMRLWWFLPELINQHCWREMTVDYLTQAIIFRCLMVLYAWVLSESLATAAMPVILLSPPTNIMGEITPCFHTRVMNFIIFGARLLFAEIGSWDDRRCHSHTTNKPTPGFINIFFSFFWLWRLQSWTMVLFEARPLMTQYSAKGKPKKREINCFGVSFCRGSGKICL